MVTEHNDTVQIRYDRCTKWESCCVCHKIVCVGRTSFNMERLVTLPLLLSIIKILCASEKECCRQCHVIVSIGGNTTFDTKILLERTIANHDHLLGIFCMCKSVNIQNSQRRKIQIAHLFFVFSFNFRFFYCGHVITLFWRENYREIRKRILPLPLFSLSLPLLPLIHEAPDKLSLPF